LALILCTGVQAHATLTTIGQAQYGGNNYNLIWDNDSPFGSIVWLDYSNAPATWASQVKWAGGLNGAGVLTYTIDPGYSVAWSGDWRLPSTVDDVLSFGYNGDGTYSYGYLITSSELGHLFYAELGNLGFVGPDGTQPQPGHGLANPGPFTSLQPSDYWSDTVYSLTPEFAWEFDFGIGLQWALLKSYDLNAIAVHSANVSVSEPGMLIFIGSGLAGLLAGRKLLRRHVG